MIEPVIGHCKSDNRLDRNYLKGFEGDRVNAILSACGFNIRKLLRKIFLAFTNLSKFASAGNKTAYYHYSCMLEMPSFSGMAIY